MPFDAIVALPRQRAVFDALERQNLTPVSWEMLAEHKQAQQRKFGPSFWYRHQAAVSIALVIASPIVGAAIGALEGFTPHASALTIGSSFVWMCMVAPIAEVARSLQREVPGSRLILGELKRDEVVLDPYLLLDDGNERVCLGIWENGRVIACAR
jgi:hypothetical protein